MAYLVIILVSILLLIILRIIYNINLREIKSIGENNKSLDEMVQRYPSNIEICKDILKKLGNEKVKIQEDKEANNCLYVAVSDKIIIANMRDSFTRIQTIAHECLHSIQDKKILLFNFIYSNFYMLYFIIVTILTILKILPNKMMFLCIYVILGFVYYFVRSYLENDAMIKARFLAKEYMEEHGILNKEECKKIIQEYDYLNHLGIKAVNFGVFSNTIIKIIILSLLMLFI